MYRNSILYYTGEEILLLQKRHIILYAYDMRIEILIYFLVISHVLHIILRMRRYGIRIYRICLYCVPTDIQYETIRQIRRDRY